MNELICHAEATLLCAIASTSSDLVKARHWAEFRDALGMKNLEDAHEKAVIAWEEWIADGDDGGAE